MIIQTRLKPVAELEMSILMMELRRLLGGTCQSSARQRIVVCRLSAIDAIPHDGNKGVGDLARLHYSETTKPRVIPVSFRSKICPPEYDSSRPVRPSGVDSLQTANIGCYYTSVVDYVCRNPSANGLILEEECFVYLQRQRKLKELGKAHLVISRTIHQSRLLKAQTQRRVADVG